jgi:hypothetical protein
MIDGRQLEIKSLEFFAAGRAFIFILIYKRLGARFADCVSTWQHQRYPISLRCQNVKAHFAFNSKLSFRGYLLLLLLDNFRTRIFLAIPFFKKS